MLKKRHQEKTCQSCSLQLTKEGLDTFSYMDMQPLEPKTQSGSILKSFLFSSGFIILGQGNMSEVRKKYLTRLCLCRQAMLI